ncbi:MAG TPA: PEP-CTERM system TPR-repeat protein PrsT [Gammaproteobacteria bacterium]|nr:PEP-CTERM system TPR-repeat protein PrsT [Gammaproteobacteria bacterium]
MKIKFPFKGRSIKTLSLVLVMALMLGFLGACSQMSSDEYLNEARNNLEKNEFQTAVINLKNALQQDSKNVQARYLLGKTYVKLGNGAGAEKELKTALALGLSSDQLVVPLAKAYLLQGKFKPLLEELKLESGFSDQLRAEILVLKAQAHVALGDADAANRLLDRVLDADPESASALLVKARVAIMQKDLVSSQQVIDELISRQSGNPETWLIAGEIARLKGDFAAARKNYDKALELEPTNAPALLGKAGADVALGDFQAALQGADQIQQQPLGSYVRGVILYKQGQMEAAEQALQKVLKVAPGHLPSQQILGSIYFADGRFEQARIALEAVLNDFPNDLAARKLLASTWLKLGRPASAIQMLEKILPANESDSQLLALLGGAYMQNKDTVKGTEYLERAVAQSPKNALIQTQVALGRLASGKTTKAVEALETAVQLGQDVFQADVLLILTHLRSGAFNKALDKARQLALKLPDSAVPDNLAGAAYAGLGDVSAARESFERALKIQSDFVPAIMNLAKLDQAAGDLKSAKARFEQIVKQHKGHVKAILALVEIAEQEGNQAEADKWLNQAWEQNTGDLQVGSLLVQYWMGRRDFVKALAIAEEMKAQHPEDFVALRAYGLVQLAAGQKNDALDTLNSLIKHYPDVAAAHTLLGRAYLATGDFTLAGRHINKALDLDDRLVSAQQALAQLAFQNGDQDKAMRIAKKLQKQRPALTVGYQLEGDLQMRSKRFSTAAKTYASGFAKAPSGVLAVKHFQAEKAYQGEKADTGLLREWLKQNPRDVAVRMVLAQAYTGAAKKQQAISQYKKILALKPKNMAALNNLAWLFYETGNNKDALDYGQKAHKQAPDNPAVTDTYGWLLLQNGKSKQGLEYLQKAYKGAPDVAEIQFHYAVALERNGQTKKAREAFAALLEKHGDFPQAAEARARLSKLR